MGDTKTMESLMAELAIQQMFLSFTTLFPAIICTITISSLSYMIYIKSINIKVFSVQIPIKHNGNLNFILIYLTYYRKARSIRGFKTTNIFHPKETTAAA